VKARGKPPFQRMLLCFCRTLAWSPWPFLSQVAFDFRHQMLPSFIGHHGSTVTEYIEG